MAWCLIQIQGQLYIYLYLSGSTLFIENMRSYSSRFVPIYVLYETCFLFLGQFNDAINYKIYIALNDILQHEYEWCVQNFVVGGSHIVF
jgi:hypothetical protein